MEYLMSRKVNLQNILVTSIIILVIRTLYIYLYKPMVYWRKKNIFYVNPWIRFFKVYFGKKSFVDNVIEAYRNYPARRYYGSTMFLKPALFIRDLELIKQITVKDFDYFPNHDSLVNERTDPVLSLNLFSLRDEKWKDMRSTLSPTFTSSKMRAMFVLIQEKAEYFVQHFCNSSEAVIELEMKDTFSKYSNDVITSCALGVECDSLKDEANIFYKMGSSISSPRLGRILRGLLTALFPRVSEFFRISAFPPFITKFFKKLIQETITLREAKKIVRPDMIHLLLETRKGRLQIETELAKENDTGFATVEESFYGKSQKKLAITDDLITAQALVFFIAGFETSSTTLSFLSYLLAVNPDVQSKLREEIDDVLERFKGKINYEELLKMKYLDQVVSETLRLYPPGYILTRICAKDYQLIAKKSNENDLLVSKGTIVVIPVVGVHMDPEYFPNPRKFNPDRFSDKNKVDIVPGTYMPFGSGPRNCIGSRFALLEVKAIIVNLLSQFEIIPTKKTTVPMKLSKTLNLAAKGGVWLGLRKRNKKVEKFR